LQREIDALIAAPEVDRGTWGIVVRNLAGDHIYSVNPRKLFVPASNMKLLTLAAAAERLGWDYSFETRLVGTGEIEANVLDGDLVVVGSGDPSVDNWDGAATRLFQQWAERLKQLGIQTIRGRIVGDDDSFDDEGWGPGWAWDDLDRSFATGVGTLQFNQNSTQLHIRPGAREADAAVITLEPSGSALTIRNRLTTSARRSAPAIEVRRLLDAPVIEIRGSIPEGSAPIVRNVAVANPTTYFVTALRDAFIASGIDVRGAAVDIDEMPDPPARARGTVLLRHNSPPLSELATTMMRLSQNLYAETFVKAIGAQHGIGTTRGGSLEVSEVLTQWGLPAGDIRVADGSGLSVYDLVSPELLVQLLAHVATDAKLAIPFANTLPVAGQDGTLAQRLKGTAAERNVRAKTGSLSNARAISGYAYTADREPLVFSILVNNFGQASDAVERTTDAILVKLAQFSRK